MSISEEKIVELKRILLLYETAITRQMSMLEQVRKGVKKSAELPEEIIEALVLNDLKILRKQKKETEDDISELEN